MGARLDPLDYAGLVRQLADPVRAREALRFLVAAGTPALPAVRAGLGDSSGEVRSGCARALDQLVDEDAWPALIAMLDDPDPRVRVHTLHALACDRCKSDTFRPDKADVLPRAIAILADDPSRHVRAMAVEVVARWVHEERAAAKALERARDEDPAPMVRKKAGWFAPGGVRHRKTAPRDARGG